MYFIARSLLYRMPPERAHYLTMSLLTSAYKMGVLGLLCPQVSYLGTTKVFGVEFPNRLGLAAGFDKDARWIEPLSALGFGFIEIGTLTPKAQPGNPKPRLFRLVDDEALINRMGFNNQGVERALDRIAIVDRKVPIGGNIGKNKATSSDDAPKDYMYCFDKLYDSVEYFTINISSPNTPGLRDLQSGEEIKRIVSPLVNERAKRSVYKPILIKIAPDLTEAQVANIVEATQTMGADGIVATNTTTDRSFRLVSAQKLLDEVGGLSGKPVREKSTEVIKWIFKYSNGKLPVIGVGGIHSPEAASEKISAGASLVQIYTGFIYEGPGLISRIVGKIG
ncbi:MAG: quinone-dependent dihydroorotate dehydrogenase [Flavobacteriales bacterium]